MIDNSPNHQEKLYGKNPKKFVTEQIDSLKLKIWFKQDQTTLLDISSGNCVVLLHTSIIREKLLFQHPLV